MLDAVRSFFSSRVPDQAAGVSDEHALHLATAALLLEVSRADFEVQQEELAVVAESLKERFGFSEAETQSLVSLALEQDNEASSLYPFLRLINDHFSVEQKSRIVEDMWKVAYADRRLDKYEESRIRKIADLLYIPHSEFIKTKLRVQEGLQRS